MMITQGYVWMLAEIYLKQSEDTANIDKPNCKTIDAENSAQDKSKREEDRACN